MSVYWSICFSLYLSVLEWIACMCMCEQLFKRFLHKKLRSRFHSFDAYIRFVVRFMLIFIWWMCGKFSIKTEQHLMAFSLWMRMESEFKNFSLKNQLIENDESFFSELIFFFFVTKLISTSIQWKSRVGFCYSNYPIELVLFISFLSLFSLLILFILDLQHFCFVLLLFRATQLHAMCLIDSYKWLTYEFNNYRSQYFEQWTLKERQRHFTRCVTIANESVLIESIG